MLVESNESTAPIKYAGADHMKTLWDKRGITPSPLGVKVADCMGQVLQGIYHYNESTYSPKIDWSNPDRIAISLPCEFASHDFCHLTILLFCCMAIGLRVEIGGAFKGYIRLTFTEGVSKDPETLLDRLLWEKNVDFNRFHAVYGGDKVLYRDDDRMMIESSRPPLQWKQLAGLVFEAHECAVRVAIRGQSTRSIAICFSQRKREGSVHERHPSLKEAIEMLKPYYSALMVERSEVPRNEP